MKNTIDYTLVEAFARTHPFTAPWNIAKHFGLTYKKATQDGRFCTAIESGIRRGVDFEYRRLKRHECVVAHNGAKWECEVCGEQYESI